jgi:cob(I)alamin adenosyltransferase
MRRIIAITGDGKGKTTSAIGVAVRAMGRNYKVFFYQFIKSKDAEYGEHLFFADGKKMEIVRLGRGCRKDFKYEQEDIDAAVKGLKKIDEELFKWTKTHDQETLVVLDEVTYPVTWNWFTSDDIIKLMDKYPDVHFVLTGREMSHELMGAADTLSTIQEIKHAYQNGVEAQKGIEF